MLSSIWAKISAGLAIVGGILLLMLKGERRARKKAEHKNKVHEKKDKIEKSQKEAKKANTRERDKRIEKANKDIDNAESIDLNSL